ncbi:unnamed protein product [Onchocerca flexuosa]|uniref:CNOT1_TTP_bind domain-containing protein n=1 Tax=Onchocerca flexuosa TaxID=387005 RepID=A0A183H0U4_9BILA|nr:unnamed protein product [Onchocerca flexuosa]
MFHYISRAFQEICDSPIAIDDGKYRGFGLLFNAFSRNSYNYILKPNIIECLVEHIEMTSKHKVNLATKSMHKFYTEIFSKECFHLQKLVRLCNEDRKGLPQHLEISSAQVQPYDALCKKALGCMYGQVIGDSLGSRYEFQPASIVQQMIIDDSVQSFLPIIGGGPSRLLPGQKPLISLEKLH